MPQSQLRGEIIRQDFYKEEVMKKILLAALLPAVFVLQGCDDSTVAAGVGLATGVIIGSNVNRAPQHCYTQYVNRCYDRMTYYGGIYRECRAVPRTVCHRHWRVNNAMALADAFPPADAATSQEARLAERYGLSFASARKVVLAFERGAHENFTDFEAIGIGRAEMKDIYEGRMIPRRSLEQMARSLNLDPDLAQAMMKDVVYRVQKARLESGR